MIQKRKTPWGFFVFLLILVLVCSYFISGLFLIQGVTVQNYQDKLLYILSHPLTLWLNEKTPAVMGMGAILWVMAVSHYLTYYRNFHPESEHGVAEWGNIKKAAKRLRDKDEILSLIHI